MSTYRAAEPVAPGEGLDNVAEVIEFPTIATPPLPLITPRPISVPDDEQVGTTPSFYQRNSGFLPKSGAGMSDAHRRTQLPTPENVDRESVADRLRRLFRR